MPWSRRRALAALAAGAATAVAGCGSEASRRRSAPGDDRRRVDYDAESVRNEDGAVLFAQRAETLTLGDDAPGESDEATPAAGERQRNPRYARNQRAYVTDAEAFDDLAWNDVPEAERLRSFAAETDFESESLYLFASEASACHEHRLTSVEVDTNGPSANFCRALRPADVECDSDVAHTVGFAIRLPFPGDEHSGHGSGMRSSCDRPGRPEPFDPDEEGES